MLSHNIFLSHDLKAFRKSILIVLLLKSRRYNSAKISFTEITSHTWKAQ